MDAFFRVAAVETLTGRWRSRVAHKTLAAIGNSQSIINAHEIQPWRRFTRPSVQPRHSHLSSRTRSFRRRGREQ
jgi:hypothetical protein